MKAVLFVLALIVAVSVAALTAQQEQFLFTKFTQQYNKQYEVSQFFSKFDTFKANLNLIVAHNAKNLSYKMAVNQFADMTAQEFAATMTGLNINLGQEYAMSQLVAPSTGVKLNPVDWVKQGKVNAVKNQASCGSCWAFAATAPLESRIAIEGGKLLDLSEQQLVDCSGSTGNNGCNGGLMSNGYEWIRKNGGICATSEYPYTAKDGSCKSTCTSVAKVSGYKAVATNDDAHIEALQAGPIGVALAASSSAFQFYSSGVLESCTDRSINHGVTMVAYGNDDGEYYTIRNSWGASWGDAGYIKIRARKSNCGLTTSSFDVYPTL